MGVGPLRIVFCGTSGFGETVLATLIASRHDVVGVVSAPPRPSGRGRRTSLPPVAGLAKEHGFPLLRPERWDDAALAWVDAQRPDRLVVADYGRRLPVSRLPEVLNIHPSLLPRWRGAAPVQRALLAGDEEVGVTVMRLTETMDAGPVYAQRRSPALRDESAGEMLDRLAREGAALLLEVLEAVEAGTARAIPQDEAEATFAPKLGREDETADPGHLPASALLRRVRAMGPVPGLKIMVNGEPLAILRAREAPPGSEVAPGRLAIVGRRLLLGTADSPVELTEVKPPGRRPMSGASYANGLRGLRGT